MSAIIERVARSTGTHVGLIDNRDGLMDVEVGWVTVCYDHGGIVWHQTRALAVGWLSHPEEWCPDCQAES